MRSPASEPSAASRSAPSCSSRHRPLQPRPSSSQLQMHVGMPGTATNSVPAAGLWRQVQQASPFACYYLRKEYSAAAFPASLTKSGKTQKCFVNIRCHWKMSSPDPSHRSARARNVFVGPPSKSNHLLRGAWHKDFGEHSNSGTTNHSKSHGCTIARMTCIASLLTQSVCWAHCFDRSRSAREACSAAVNDLHSRSRTVYFGVGPSCNSAKSGAIPRDLPSGSFKLFIRKL